MAVDIKQNSSGNERIILVVKIPDLGITKKILFDRVETIKDAVDLIIEKLPPGSLEFIQHYNIYLPQKSKWCKLDSPFSKYKFKENQEIEFKKDTRSNVSHILSSVGNLMKPYRTVYIKLPEIMQTGILSDSNNASSNTSNNNNSSGTQQTNFENSNTSTGNTTPRTKVEQATSLSSSTNSISRSSSLRTSSNAVEFNGLSKSTPIIGIPKLNLSVVNNGSGNNSNSGSPQLGTSPQSSPRGVLEQKKSLLKIITGVTSTASGNTTPKSQTTPLNITPRNLGTFSRSSEESIRTESFDFDDDITLLEILSKIYQKYQHIDKDLLEDYSLVQSDGTWLTDRSKTLPELGIKHMEDLEFKRKSQKVKIIFLNRELLLSLNPYDTLKEINYKIISQYLPSLVKLHRSSSISQSPSSSNGNNTISGSNTTSKSFRSSVSIEPINLLLLEQNYLDTNNINGLDNNRSHRSFSDASPLSFSNSGKDLVLPQQQSVENVLIKRKSSFGSKTDQLVNNNSKKSDDSKPLSLQLGYQQLYSNLPQELQEFKDFKLFLSSKYNNPLINNRFDLCLDEKRTLQSFNLWNNVKLHFKNTSTCSIINSNNVRENINNLNNSNSNNNRSILKTSNNQQNGKLSVPFYLVIECEAMSLSSVVTIENSSNVNDVHRAFTRFLISNESNNPIKDSLEEYGLYFDTVDSSIGKREGFEYSGGLVYLDSSKPLAQYPLEPLDRLVFKRTNTIFAIDPLSMPQKLDATLNLQIPALLVDLKSKFIQMNGFLVEGLFRVNNNSDSAFQWILNSVQDQNQLNTTTATTTVDKTVDVHSIISFIKRWFMKLPRKLCQDLDDDTLQYASTQELAAEHAMESISPPYRALLQWLVRFLAEIIQSSSINKSSPKSLSMAVGPLLVSNNTNTVISSSNDSTKLSSLNNSNQSNTTTSVTIKQSLSSSNERDIGSLSNLEKLNQSTLFLQHLIKLKLKQLGCSNLTTGSFSTSNNSTCSEVMTGSESSLLSSSLISRSPSYNDMNDV